MYKTYHGNIELETPSQGLVAIQSKVEEIVSSSGVSSGSCAIYCPHTTAGITVNENYDPDVAIDFIFAMDKTYPDRREFRHSEGNSAAHLKASAMGCQQTIIIKEGRLLLGRWQGIYFCEFDGPRNRRVEILVQGE